MVRKHKQLITQFFTLHILLLHSCRSIHALHEKSNFTTLLKYHWFLPNTRFQTYRKQPRTRGQGGSNGRELPDDGRVCHGGDARRHLLSSPCASLYVSSASSTVCLRFCLFPFPLQVIKIYFNYCFVIQSSKDESLAYERERKRELLCVIRSVNIWKV